MKLLNFAFHGVHSRCQATFWKKSLGIATVHVVSSDDLSIDPDSLVVPSSSDLTKFCDYETLLIVPNNKELLNAYTKHPYLRQLKVAWAPGRRWCAEEWTSSNFMMAFSYQYHILDSRLRCLVMPRLTGLVPQAFKRNYNQFGTFISLYEDKPEFTTFVQIQNQLARYEIELKLYGARQAGSVVDYSSFKADTQVMPYLGGVVHVRTSASDNAVSRCIAMGTPIFMDTTTYFSSYHEQFRGIVVRDSIPSLVEAILSYTQNPEPLLAETSLASIHNQQISTAKKDEALSWLKQALSL